MTNNLNQVAQNWLVVCQWYEVEIPSFAHGQLECIGSAAHCEILEFTFNPPVHGFTSVNDVSIDFDNVSV